MLIVFLDPELIYTRADSPHKTLADVIASPFAQLLSGPVASEWQYRLPVDSQFYASASFAGYAIKDTTATGPYTVHVAITVADRDTGEPQQYGFTLEVPDRCPVAGGLSAVLRRAYDHELDENIYASGVRVYEPHPEPLATPATAADDSARRGSGGL